MFGPFDVEKCSIHMLSGASHFGHDSYFGETFVFGSTQLRQNIIIWILSSSGRGKAVWMRAPIPLFRPTYPTTTAGKDDATRWAR